MKRIFILLTILIFCIAQTFAQLIILNQQDEEITNTTVNITNEIYFKVKNTSSSEIANIKCYLRVSADDNAEYGTDATWEFCSVQCGIDGGCPKFTLAADAEQHVHLQFTQVNNTPRDFLVYTYPTGGNPVAIFTIHIVGDTNNHTITAVSANPNQGTVTGSGTYPDGSIVTLTAIAANDYHFVSWNDNNTDNPRRITVTGDATYTAYFEENTYTPIHNIQYTTDENGDSPLNNQTVWVKGVVTSNFTNTPYFPIKGYSIQDANEAWCGVWVFDSVNNPNIGDSVRFQARVTEYFGLTELKNVTNYEVYDTGTVTPIDVTVNESKSEAYEGCYVRVECVRSTGNRMPYGNWTCVNEANDTVSFSHNFASDAYTIEEDRTYSISGIVEYAYGRYYVNYPTLNDITPDCIRHTIIVTAYNDYAGTVSGGGSFGHGTHTTISATAYQGFRFSQWNDGNTDNPRSITVTEDATYIAYFEYDDPYPPILVTITDTACGSYTLNNVTYTESGEYQQTITSSNSNDTIIHLVLEIYPLPEPEIIVDGILNACSPETAVTLSVSAGEYNEYYWSNGERSETITITTPGNFYVEVVDNHECHGYSETTTIGSSSIIIETPQLTRVGMSNNGTNVVQWTVTDTTGIRGYEIYRENNVADVYTRIMSVSNPRQRSCSDLTADPSSRAYRYKICAIDECGGLSPMSNYHKTMHLTINRGIGNTWNLIWSHYEGIEFGTYKIYRGTTMQDMVVIGEVPSNMNSYTDNNNPNSTGFFYKVVVETNNRSVEENEMLLGSNIVDNGCFAEYTIIAVSTNPNLGTVTGGGTYPEGSIVTLNAIANDGFQFSSWTDGNTNNPRYIMVNGNATYIASFSPNSVEENITNEISVFPNPTNDILNVTSSETISDIEIINTMGQIVKHIDVHSDKTTCYVQDLTSGVYLLRIYGTDTAIYQRKFIKR